MCFLAPTHIQRQRGGVWEDRNTDPSENEKDINLQIDPSSWGNDPVNHIMNNSSSWHAVWGDWLILLPEEPSIQVPLAVLK